MRGRPGFFDKTVQHDNPSSDHSAVEHPGDPFSTFEAKLEKSIAHGFGVRLPEVGSNGGHTAGEYDVSGRQSLGQTQDLLLHLLTEIVNRVFHAILTNMLLPLKRPCR